MASRTTKLFANNSWILLLFFRILRIIRELFFVFFLLPCGTDNSEWFVNYIRIITESQNFDITEPNPINLFVTMLGTRIYGQLMILTINYIIR